MACRLKFVMLVLLPALAACASGPEFQEPAGTGVVIEGIIIQNGLSYTVENVMVEVPATGGFAGCGNILPRTDCRTSFQAVDYRQNPIQVAWEEHGVPQKTDEFIVELPPGSGPGDSFWLEVVIYAPGLAGARIVQP